mmetsp:Transcript_54676/g.122991  ORF Transcript_54676/g.122991 Transcript_54676/m.122991 type:complete len:297 (-) Transcript_54676:812-1702(-)
MTLTMVRSSTLTTFGRFPCTASCTSLPMCRTTRPFSPSTVVSVCPTRMLLLTSACGSGWPSLEPWVPASLGWSYSSSSSSTSTDTWLKSRTFPPDLSNFTAGCESCIACGGDFTQAALSFRPSAPSPTTRSKVQSYSSCKRARCSPGIEFQMEGVTPLPTRKARYVGSRESQDKLVVLPCSSNGLRKRTSHVSVRASLRLTCWSSSSSLSGSKSPTPLLLGRRPFLMHSCRFASRRCHFVMESSCKVKEPLAITFMRAKPMAFSFVSLMMLRPSKERAHHTGNASQLMTTIMRSFR